MQNAKKTPVLLLFSLGFYVKLYEETINFQCIFLKVGPSRPLPNPPITHRDNLVCVAAQAFIATLFFDPSMSALPIIVKQNPPNVSSSFC